MLGNYEIGSSYWEGMNRKKNPCETFILILPVKHFYPLCLATAAFIKNNAARLAVSCLNS